MSKPKIDTVSEYHLHHNEPQKLQFAVHDLNDYLERYRPEASQPHIHSYYQIIWFQSGAGKHHVDFKSYDVGENEIFLIAMNQVHHFDLNQDYQGYLLHFNEPFLLPENDKMDLFLKSSLFNNPYQTPQCSIGNGTGAILLEYIGQIRAELAAGVEFARQELLRIYLKAFLIQIQRRKNDLETDAAPLKVDEKRLQLAHFVNLVSENYAKGLSVAEYAELMHISTRTLSDLTAHLLNKSPLQMIQERVILEAKRWLSHSGMNVSQVGYRLGFDDPSYFVKYFRKHTGISPSEFRLSVRSSA